MDSQWHREELVLVVVVAAATAAVEKARIQMRE